MPTFLQAMIPRLFLLASLAILVSSKGVYFWCYYSHKYLDTIIPGTTTYTDLDAAKQDCLQISECFGITKEEQTYSLRKGWQLKYSSKSVVSWVPCGGYFRCLEFGLKSSHGSFLSVDAADGSLSSDSSHYGMTERVEFHQWGKDAGFFKSQQDKYLLGNRFGGLKWDSDNRGSSERFTLFQDQDKVSFQSRYGDFLSANLDGSVTLNPTQGKSEWFFVYPPDCLNNMYCNCSKEIVSEDYTLVELIFDTSNGSVTSFNPDRVGYQLINNTDSTAKQSTTFTVAEEVSEKTSFSHTAGASVKVGTQFRSSIPTVGSYQISLDVTAKYEYKTGEERKVKKKMEAKYNCVAPAGKVVSCEALLFKYRLDVPYTQTWKHRRLPCSCESRGVFTEIAAHEMRLMVNEE